ncbi:MAG TPA: D-TA family PLP-dependent enzyme [Segetibacter sp.]
MFKFIPSIKCNFMNSGANEWYNIINIEEIDSPALVIYLERVKHNIDLAISMVGDASLLRPHVKTHKTKEATLLMMQVGISKFKCATIAEAEMLGMCNAPDVLLAYQPVGPKLKRFISLTASFPNTRFSCLVDNTTSANLIAEEALANNTTVNAFIDLNIGMNRTGILAENALELYKHCHLLEGLNIVGIHGYDGHINDPDLQLRTQRSDDAFRKVEEVKHQLIGNGFTNPLVVMGGSPTFPIHAKRTGIECSPGTFVYWDKGYSDLFPDMKFLPAALVVTRAISLLNEITICVDLGHKSIAAENPLDRRVWFLDEPGAKFISQSEEHLVIELPASHTRKVGDVLYGMPIHICPTCALYETAFVIENNKTTGQWKMIARDRKISI